MWTIRYRPEIEGDLRSGSGWYNSKRDGLDDEFIVAYWDTVDQIADRPLSFAVASNGLRPCRLSRFPYVAHFRVVDQEILIVAVMSAARDDTAFTKRGEPSDATERRSRAN